MVKQDGRPGRIVIDCKTRAFERRVMRGRSYAEVDKIKTRPDKEYLAGLDISMHETHVCVLDREGVVVRESKTASTARAIADELAKPPRCRRVVFDTGECRRPCFTGRANSIPVV